MKRDEEGFEYPKIDKNICVECGKCDSVCPSLNFVEKVFNKVPAVYFAINTDEKIRRHSSSGGVFSALSKIILDDGGIVFGAGFDEKFHVSHKSAENFDELENLRGSKYVQSRIGNIFKQIKKNLKRNRKVLFSGTACQCAGLKSFLGRDFENLLTVDVFCHGVPSPVLWESYIDWHAKFHEISHVNFRSKHLGWADSHIQITFEDCTYYLRPFFQDFYIQEFLLNLTLRPSCCDCKFKYPNIESDLSIGDAWGVQNYAPQLFDNRGISQIVIHTEKAVEILNKCDLLSQPAPFEMLWTSNSQFLVPVIEDPRRKDFFADLKKINNPVAVMQKYFLEDFSQIAGFEAQKTQQLLQEKFQRFSER